MLLIRWQASRPVLNLGDRLVGFVVTLLTDVDGLPLLP